MDPAFRDRAPRIVKDNETGKERLVIEEHKTDARINIGRTGAVGARQGVVEPDAMAYKDGKLGGFDPHARIPDMDADGIDAAFLYPSLGLFSGAIHDPQLAAAVCRAYNRWLADYCSAYPDRLFGVAMLPMQEVDLAIGEMRYAKKELGMRGGFLRPNPYHGLKMMSDPMYEPFLAVLGLDDPRRAVAELGVDVFVPQIERLEDVPVGVDDVVSAGHWASLRGANSLPPRRLP